MKKQSVFVLVTVLAAVVAFSGMLVASADQENNIDIPHEHEYYVSSFDKGEAVVTCEICGDSYDDNFTDHLNNTGDDVFDVNYDGIVNGKDYAYLKQHKTGWRSIDDSVWEIPINLL
ncbi:MAG: hypothetical protein IKF64_06525 [Eubacterium sp.]|nr:hypothetical protein [Eubacterium sp.]